MEHFRKKYTKAVFLVLSDDMTWCRYFFAMLLFFLIFFATVIWPWHNTSIFKFQLWLLLFTLPLSTLHLFNMLTSHSLHWNCNHFCSTLNCNSGGSWGALTSSMLEAMLQRWTWPSWHLVMPPSYVSHTCGAEYCRLVICRLLSFICIFSSLWYIWSLGGTPSWRRNHC